MTSFDRFMTALELKEPDRVPVWELIINEPTLSALFGTCSSLDFVEKAGLDGVTIFENNLSSPVGPGTAKDEWGILWRTTDTPIPYPVEGPIRSEEDLNDYQPPDPLVPHRLQDLEQAVKRFKDSKAVVFLTHDAFEFSHYLRGTEGLLMDYALNSRLAHRLARLVVDYKKEVMLAAIDLGADVIVSGDDYAFRTGPLMSPANFKEFILPYLKEMIRAAHRKGVPFIKHTDGNIWPILDDLVSAGIDALDPLEPLAGMDIGEVKEAYGDRIALVGNVDCTEILPHASQEEVVEAVKETIAKASPGGGHILASSNSIHPGVKPENYRAMLEAARRFGAYALDGDMVKEYSTRSYIRHYLGERQISSLLQVVLRRNLTFPATVPFYMGKLNSSPSPPNHLSLLKKGLALEYFTIAWNCIEAAVAVVAGVLASSVALVGFGLDSVIEIASGATLAWRLHAEIKGADQQAAERTERKALLVVGLTFFALALYILWESGKKLLLREIPQESLPGMILAVVSLIVMPVLALGKLRVARPLGSQALKADAMETAVCSYLSFTLLLGLGLNAGFGWWWADPVAGLLMLPLIVREGWKAILESRKSE